MRRQLKRLGFALVVSIGGIVATLAWYYAGQTRSTVAKGSVAIARLTEANDEVQRRETDRVIWESLSPDDDLFVGEALRTSPQATAKIRLKSGVTIHLDPDSLVVLDQNDRGLSLDFLEGNLFVEGSQTGASDESDAVTLKTGRGEVSLARADVSLSKGAGGDVSLDVFRGRAELKRDGRTTTLAEDKSATLSADGVAEAKDQLRITTPRAGETVWLNLAGREKLPLAWSKLPAGYHVTVSLGQTRATLAPAADAWPGDAGSATLTLKPGRWFVRLTATADRQPTLSSPVIPFRIEPRAAPVALEPAADHVVRPTGSDHAVQFRWLDRQAFAQHALEIGADARFTSVVRRERLGGSVTAMRLPLAAGRYFWRVTGFPNGGAAGLSGPARAFTVNEAPVERVTLEQPTDHARFARAEVSKRGVTLRWLSDAEGERTVTVRDANDRPVFTARGATGRAHVADLGPGEYRWGVDDAKPFHFTVVADPVLATLAWSDANAVTEYLDQTPTIRVRWQAADLTAARYRVRVAPADRAIAEAPWRGLTTPEATTTVESDGEYQIEAEALGPDGATVAATPLRRLRVRRRPTLGAPTWSARVDHFTSDARGNVTLGWNSVEGAKAYELSITDPAGRTLTKSVPRGPASLTSLRPGRYRLRVRGIDDFDRAGAESDVKILNVPEASDIRAPRIKAMTVR